MKPDLENLFFHPHAHIPAIGRRFRFLSREGPIQLIHQRLFHCRKNANNRKPQAELFPQAEMRGSVPRRIEYFLVD